MRDLKVGDYIYCHTTGYWNDNPLDGTFVVEGEYCYVLRVGEYNIRINTSGSNPTEGHQWRFEYEELFYKYFRLLDKIEPVKRSYRHKMLR